jgi:hypothetical protein
MAMVNNEKRELSSETDLDSIRPCLRHERKTGSSMRLLVEAFQVNDCLTHLRQWPLRFLK